MDNLQIFCMGLLMYSCLKDCNGEACNSPLGMANGKIKDSQIYSPPEAQVGGTMPWDARLNGPNGWCVRSAKASPHFKSSYYLQVDLLSTFTVSGIQLQRSASLTDYQYGDSFQLQYKVLEQDSFTTYTTENKNNGILTSNLKSGTDTVTLENPFVARFIRMFPVIDENPKCVRLEILGCPLSIQSPAPATTDGGQACTESILGLSFNDDKYFNESSFRIVNGVPYPAKYVLFSLPFGWCPNNLEYKAGDPDDKEWMYVDMQGDYRVTGFQTSGYKQTVQATTDLYALDSVSLEFGSTPSQWMSYKEQNAVKKFNGSVKGIKVLENPFVARFVKVKGYITSADIKCLKIQLYGCKFSGTTAPTKAPVTTPSTIGPTQTLEAAVKFYSIYQGSKWKGLYYSDSKYNGSLYKENVLRNGVGLLTDGVEGERGPLLTPSEWLGWARALVKDPFISLTFNGKILLKDMRLTVFVSKQEGMGLFESVRTYYDHKATTAALYSCTSNEAATMKEGSHDVSLDFGDTEVEMLMLMFDYSSDWLMISEISINKGLNGVLVFKVTQIACRATMPQGKDKSAPVGVIVGGCLAFLAFVVVIFLIFFLRKSSFRRKRAEKGQEAKKQELELIKSMTDNPIYDQSKAVPNYTEVYVDNDADNRTPLIEKDPVYAAPDIDIHNDDDPPAGYSAVENLSYPMENNKMDVSYAEPGSPMSPNDIEFNPIYEQTYENPYKAVSGSSMYADPELQAGRKSFEIKRFPRDKLKFVEKIGCGQFGQVIICDVDGLREILGPDIGYSGPDRALVAVKTLKAGVDQSVQKEFMKEVRVMARLEHENVVNLLGVCDDEPKCMVVEYMENGDLNQFLKDSKRYEGPANPRVSQLPQDVILVDTLMYMAMQVASGMNYLSSHGFIHRDLATRNCLVGPAFTVKISDFGMSRYLYSKQYYRIEGKAILPIRWMAPESLFYGKFTSYTDVWAFGVTIWEIFSYARETPYASMSDQQVIDNACSFVQERRRLFQHLRQPTDCPGPVYNVMMQCWAKTPEDRPTFEAIYSFFNQAVGSQEGSI